MVERELMFLKVAQGKMNSTVGLETTNYVEELMTISCWAQKGKISCLEKMETTLLNLVTVMTCCLVVLETIYLKEGLVRTNSEVERATTSCWVELRTIFCWVKQGKICFLEKRGMIFLILEMVMMSCLVVLATMFFHQVMERMNCSVIVATINWTAD